jgi:rhodanese-related sulfurtransferase
MSDIDELTPTDLFLRWPSPLERNDILLIDVREPDELARAAIRGALHMPMREVPARLDELPRDKALVVMCHAGGRSRRVAEFLHANGFEQVFNLRGGIDAWSQEIDRSVPRY